MATSPALMDYLKSLGIDTSKLDQQSQLQKSDYGMLGNGIGGLMDLYSGGKVADAYGSSASSAEDQANQLQQQMQQMPTLATMYGADSPYAKQLAATLQAKDAAAGRNSQYGNRAVQLQAMLADKGSQYATAQAQMANQYNAARTAANNARTQATTAQQGVYAKTLGNLFNLGNQTGYLQQGNNYLRQMFNPDQPAPTQEQVNTYSQGGPSTGMYGTPVPVAAGYIPTQKDYSLGSPSMGYSGTPQQPTAYSEPLRSWNDGGRGPDTYSGNYNGSNGIQIYQPTSNGLDEKGAYTTGAGAYSPGMDTTQAPTSSNNAYSMDYWSQPWDM